MFRILYSFVHKTCFVSEKVVFMALQKLNLFYNISEKVVLKLKYIEINLIAFLFLIHILNCKMTLFFGFGFFLLFCKFSVGRHFY